MKEEDEEEESVSRRSLKTQGMRKEISQDSTQHEVMTRLQDVQMKGARRHAVAVMSDLHEQWL